MSKELLGGFTCATCGKKFLPGPDTYIGPEDPNDNECHPFMAFVELCEVCAGPTLARIEDDHVSDR